MAGNTPRARGKVTTIGNGKAAVDFDPLLPSRPIKAPFPGHQGEVGFIYNIERVMSLRSERGELIKDMLAEQDVVFGEMTMAQEKYRDDWKDVVAAQAERDMSNTELVQSVTSVVDDEDLDDDSKVDALRALFPQDDVPEITDERLKEYEAARTAYHRLIGDLNAKNEGVNRRIAIRVLSYIIHDVQWPFTGDKPDFSNPETIRFSNLVLLWLISDAGGLGQVVEQMTSPLSAIGS